MLAFLRRNLICEISDAFYGKIRSVRFWMPKRKRNIQETFFLSLISANPQLKKNIIYLKTQVTPQTMPF